MNSRPGIDVHYVHVKPKRVPEGTSAVPLIMVHGWPGSFYEFYGMIPLLTEPSNPNDVVFEVVCPSIPGYGFSEAPHKKGVSEFLHWTLCMKIPSITGAFYGCDVLVFRDFQQRGRCYFSANVFLFV